MPRPRKLTPEFEHELLRDPQLGYEPVGSAECVRCIAHGSPTPLERWHCHDESELQLIVGARGRAFVGDHVGHFEPGHLVLTGPRLPHNWVSTDLPEGGLPVRSLVIQFREEPLRRAMAAIPALEELLPLLKRSRRGIEFFGLSERVQSHFERIQHSHGLARFAQFVELLGVLSGCTDYRLLSSAPQIGLAPGDAGAALAQIVAHVHAHYAEPLAASDMAARAHMSESRFSRAFGKASGSSFAAFVNGVRIHKACELLMNSEQQIASICYAVGFNNLANFNRRFREVKGITPREFRRLSMDRLGGTAARSNS
ncbi:MAG: hypothetical protein RJA98_2214 [Pseudomonadota bacterium]